MKKLNVVLSKFVEEINTISILNVDSYSIKDDLLKLVFQNKIVDINFSIVEGVVSCPTLKEKLLESSLLKLLKGGFVKYREEEVGEVLSLDSKSCTVDVKWPFGTYTLKEQDICLASTGYSYLLKSKL